MSSSFIRQRTQPKGQPLTEKPVRDDIVWGKTPGGEVFSVPTTHDVLTLFHPSYPKSHLDILNLGLLGLQLVLFFCLSTSTARIFFGLYFAFWRAAYDAGLGWVLTKQSKKKWIVREIQRLGWLDGERRPKMRHWIRAQLQGKMGKDYSFDELPLEYNAWLLYRQLVDVILLNDFLSYCLFAFSCFRVPEGLSLTAHIMRWVVGITMIAFNAWVKAEAHHVVKDYGWYWGDVFFRLSSSLVFDGVFELAPHPMYSVGYAGYYGLSLIVGSYPVLFISLAAHAAQFAFLVLFENPHIERMYGQRKLLAQRTRLAPRLGSTPVTTGHRAASSVSTTSSETPAVTEGESATDTELDTEMEMDVPSHRTPKPGSDSFVSSHEKPLSQHDLLTKYFRRDTVLLVNLDLLRSQDLMLVLVIAYATVYSLLPNSLSPNTALTLHFVHALGWCLFHCVGLGLVLKAQSKSKFLVRHFLKHYHYEHGKGAVAEAFLNWKTTYNLSMCMTYVSFFGLAWKNYSFPTNWTVGNELLRHTLGALLVGLHIWASLESFEVLGVFGWFFGDFFMEDFPSHLEYTGIYRYLNNPEVMSGAAFFGLAMVSNSKLVTCIAVIRHLANWWFLSKVENPHMRKLYGDTLRGDAGFVKVMKNVASKNVRMLETRAGRHGPEIKRVAKEVIGTFDKVYEETADAVEEFLAKSRPRLSGVVQDTKVLLQQSRERLVITRVANENDMSSHDANLYKVSLVGGNEFHLGEPIRVHWTAPHSHSRRDWIGIYRVGANKSTLVTKKSSLGMWIPVHDEEWDGDVHIGSSRSPSPSKDLETGIVTFRAGTLPWSVGKYEIRYHHDGKYNVMALDGPFEVYVDQPAVLDFPSVRSTLMRIVPLCLDSDPSLIPISCNPDPAARATTTDGEADDRDADDFRFWSERQAKRICVSIKQAFDVDYAPDVVVADANLTALANRILLSKEILTTKVGSG